MYHNTLIQKNHPEQESLEKVIELVLGFIEADSIYFSSQVEDGLNDGILLVIIGENSPHYWDDVYEYSWKIFHNYPQFSFRIFDSSWVKEEIENGNLFYVMHCNSDTLVYSSTESSDTLYPESIKLKRFLKNARSRYRIEDECAFTISLNVKYYKKGKNYLQAAYTLHQSIRCLFISASWFLTGEWLVLKSLAKQQEHISKFSQTLGRLFNMEDEKECLLMEQLDNACAAVQGNQSIPEIDLAIIEAVEAKLDPMRKEVLRLFEMCTSRCENVFSQKSPAVIELEDSNPQQLLAKIITGFIETRAIYCFGQRTSSYVHNSVVVQKDNNPIENTHFYLLVFVEKYRDNATADIIDIVKTKTNGRYTATILMHSKKSLESKSGDQQYFFYQIMQQGQLIFKNVAKPAILHFDKIPSRNIKSTGNYLQQRNLIVNTLMEHENFKNKGATKVNTVFKHLIVEQISLGLIRLFLGYTPQHYSLGFLFDLCEHFTSLTAEIFPRKTENDKALFRTLANGTSFLRYGAADTVDYSDYEILRNRCDEFARSASELTKNELERIQNRNIIINN